MFASHGGMLNPYKGGKFLMEMLQLASVNHEKWFLIEVGAAGPKTEYPVESVSIPYIGDEKELALYYSASDIFVSPSISESFGLMVCEAQACGTPVVAFSAGGIVEIVEHEKTGFLVHMGNVAHLYQRVKMVLESPKLAEGFGKNARNRVERLFSAKMMGRKYLQLYEEIVASQK